MVCARIRIRSSTNIAVFDGNQKLVSSPGGICRGKRATFYSCFQIAVSLLAFPLGISFVSPFSQREATENSLAELCVPRDQFLYTRSSLTQYFRFSVNFDSHCH